ncbi:hypothetical protein [Brevundimonas sp.]|uniref:hypothetical protein n=1 Tax=Brevundimonas sp. TaxID=1871086 RepID=UPI002D6EC9F6|nr:hypothetical protein [Brevundimonas sp.]HYD28894.1 hypothetical protein [Brevundimonas sp.]
MTTDTQAAGADEPVNINALGPQNAAEQVTETRRFENNIEAADAKSEEAIKAQTAPNPTTDADLAREAYGEDWNKRRRGREADKLADTDHREIAETKDGEPIYAHGGVAVDAQGHALGHADDPQGAVNLRERLWDDPPAKDSDRYPVTAEARERDEADDES